MAESEAGVHRKISHDLMLARLTQSEQMREFFIQMWLQNPQLARQAGARVQSLLSPLAPLGERQKTFGSSTQGG